MLILDFKNSIMKKLELIVDANEMAYVICEHFLLNQRICHAMHGLCIVIIYAHEIRNKILQFMVLHFY